jgi:hypothetical protein
MKKFKFTIDNEEELFKEMENFFLINDFKSKAKNILTLRKL